MWMSTWRMGMGPVSVTLHRASLNTHIRLAIVISHANDARYMGKRREESERRRDTHIAYTKLPHSRLEMPID